MKFSIKSVSLVTCLTLIVVLCTQNVYAAETKTAQDIVDDMKIGWNLGNSLDSYNEDIVDLDIFNTYQSSYQAMVSYSTTTYSGWDAAGYNYFSDDTCTLSWDMSSLNSNLNWKCGCFTVKLINHDLVNTIDIVDFSITDVNLTKADGTKVDLSSCLGDYISILSNSETDGVTIDLSNIERLSTTSDLIGAKLTIKLKINSYPLSSSLDADPISDLINYYETLWGNSETTKELVDQVKDKGFQAVRVPVTWYNHIDENGNIDEAWLKRVKEVVDYVIDNGMYCIINVHHDSGLSGWIYSDTDTYDTNKEDLINIWEQVATYFKDYNDKLLFESTNEIINIEDSWDWVLNYEDFQVVHDLNQEFISTIRSTGDNNKSRYLVVTTFGASSDDCEIEQSFYKDYEDTISDHLILNVHNYTSNTNTISALMETLNNYSEEYDIPVIIDEFGTTSSMNLDDRIEAANDYVSTAKEYGITCFWWDNGADFGLIDRDNYEWVYESLVDTLIQSATK